MKYAHTFLLYIVVLAGLPLLGHAQNKTLKVADQLVSERKYLSAYRLLEQADPNAHDPAITIRRTEIATSYFAKSLDHTLFGLIDLPHGEDLDSIRRTDSGSYTMVWFRPDSALSILLDRYPDNAALHLALGNYYYNVWQIYGNEWFISDSALADGSEAQLFDALRHGLRDNNTYSRLGYLALDRQDYSIASGYYHTAIDSGSIDVSDYYNIAVCDLYQDKYPEGISYARYSFEHYTDPSLKGDAAHLLGSLYTSTAAFDSAVTYFLISLDLDSLNSNSMAKLVIVYCESHRPADASKWAERYFDVAPGQETLNDIVRSFHEWKQDDALVAWFEHMKGKYAKDDETSGGLRLVQGQYYLLVGDKPNARRELNEARTYFQQVYDEDNEAFPFIEDLLTSAK
ncbi:MAG: hypothetical protein JSS75_02460 [Bacteroidetes bacterium]|nr:hypothetical protein [Bacteroidota bacterium]